jgi:hypothetical protein
MRGFANIIKHSLLRLATVLSALLVGMTFALTTSVASAAVVNGVNGAFFIVPKPKVVQVVVQPTSKVEVLPVVKEAVMPQVKSDSKVRQVRPFFARPFFFRSFGFNQFFDEDFD